MVKIKKLYILTVWIRYVNKKANKLYKLIIWIPLTCTQRKYTLLNISFTPKINHQNPKIAHHQNLVHRQKFQEMDPHHPNQMDLL